MNSLILWHYYTKKSPEWANASVLPANSSAKAFATAEALAQNRSWGCF